MTTKIELNKDLSVDYTEWKKNITSKGYSYYDFSREEVERIAKKNVKEVSGTEIRTLVQALFPQYLQCSGLFDGFLFFEVNNGVRIDPPKYCYATCNSYLDNNTVDIVVQDVDFLTPKTDDDYYPDEIPDERPAHNTYDDNDDCPF